MTRPARSIRLLAPLALLGLLAACSTAKPGNAPPESATTIGAMPAAPYARPESLPRAEPTLVQPMPVAPAASAPAFDTATGERATIARLEREARAIARATGCASARACRSAGVGVKACGGPRTYLTYCAATTDTVSLARKLRELERVERAYNERSGMMSTCEMRLAPVTTLVGGTCSAAQGVGGERVP